MNSAIMFMQKEQTEDEGSKKQNQSGDFFFLGGTLGGQKKSL